MTGVLSANLIRISAANIASGTRKGVVNGRNYSCAVGSVIDVPEADAAALEAQGFISLGQVGTTATRPTYPPTSTSEARVVEPPFGKRMVDTTIGAAIIFNGSVWINAVTGATV